MEKEGKEKTSVSKYSDKKVARIPKDLFEFDKVRWKLSVLPCRLLFMLSQSVSSHADELFPFEFSLDAVFQYLNLTNDGRRFQKLHEACEELMKSGLHVCQQKANGKRLWAGISFVGRYSFEEDGKVLMLTVNPDARNFFVKLKQYAALQPKYYLRLSTDYQNWFYPYLKLRWQIGYWEVSIKDLLFMLYLDKTPSYTTDVNANKNFFNRVLGIQKPKGWRYKTKGINLPWEYVRDKSGSYTGTLATITRETDLNVTAFPIMESGKYVAIRFDLSIKTGRLSNTEREQLHQRAVKNSIDDMGKPSRRKRSGKAVSVKETMRDLFNSIPTAEQISNPIARQEEMPKGRLTISPDTMKSLAKAKGMTIPRFAKEMGYELCEDGNYKKKE